MIFRSPAGKFWHRHRRPYPVVYSSDPEFHLNAKRDSDSTKTIAKKKGGAAALRAQSTTLPTTPVEGPMEPDLTTRSKTEVWVEVPPRPSLPSVLPSEDDRAISPISTASSASEPPLAERVKANGASRSHSTPPAPTNSGPSSSNQQNSEVAGNPISPAVDTPDTPARTSSAGAPPVSPP
jgi:SWI/SNF-related matrix-associated actin-dependent regulator of chromatin subfamily B protein 1